jgi:O-antigen/teichoic acid export membrane protein
VQIPWLVIDDDLDDVSDVWDLSRSSWWILAFAAVNLGLAFRTRATQRRGQPSASTALATIVCSGLMLVVFLAHGVRSDDLGVWPAAIGAAISAVSAALFRRGFSQLNSWAGSA